MPQRLFHSSTLIGFAAAVCCPAAALADAPVPTSRLMQVPPQLQVREESEVRTARTASKREEFEKSYDLFIRYTDGSIYNPSTATYDKVKLRAYQQKSDKSWNAEDGNSAGFQAPTVVMVPGQTVRFRLYNQLPELTSTQCASTDVNAPGQPGCFNTTNLHSHGLWVSPSGNSDNVLLSIRPNVNFEYEYNIPIDHPAGTFWYHPHQHGSTAIQVASGMAGALIVEGDRYPTVEGNGDLDTLLKRFRPASGSAAEVMLLQQIPYGCQSAGQAPDWDCGGAQAKVGMVEDFRQVGPPNAWKLSGRYTTLNGQVQPILKLRHHQVYRWRMIDSGFQSTVVLRIKGAVDGAALERYIKRPNQGEDVEKLCNGVDVTQFEVATDGLTHEKIISKTANYLQPGYRSDILFALPAAGAYCIYDEKSKDNLNEAAKNTRLLGIIVVPESAGAAPGGGERLSQFDFMRTELVRAAELMPAHSLPAAVKRQIVEGLQNALRLDKFVPHPGFSQAQQAKLRAAPKQYVTFDIAKLGGIDRFMVEGDPALKQEADVKFAYQAGRIDHLLVLGDEQMWELNSKVGSHPFHIHVNPFQIVSIVNLAPGAGPGDIDPQYKDLVGTWKDTLLVMKDYRIEVATRYERYIGEYVLHCHILEHEDQGMMQNVKVVLPDGKGGAAAGGHGDHH
jgi:FtsP/CotA-like multicopper oxidase with cupredoxin domain